MKIFVDKIPEGGLELSEKIEPGSLLLEDQTVISFLNPIDVKADVTKTSGEIFVDISVESPVEYTCVKCLSRFDGIFRKKFNVIREVKPAEVVELDDEIRQEIILDYPMKVICKPDCKGLCPNCGQNLNAGECECGK
ncbi:MAG: DUF177 domain-containing protein [Candidatus Omnitrophota bacterium]|nr:DUF177 domain-containing protein [Candidatus Omnitrophota bacterium]